MTSKSTILSHFVCVALLLLFSHSAISQTYYPEPTHEEWFKAIPKIDAETPEWAVVMYTDDANYERIMRLKDAFDRQNPYKKTIHIQNFKHWFKIVSNYVNDDGLVELPDPSLAFLESKVKYEKQSGSKMMDVWSNIGPYETVNFDANGNPEARPTQANIFSLAVAPSNTNVVYASAETGGIFKTVDKGINWFPVAQDFVLSNMQDLKVDEFNENIVYGARGSQLFKTVDGGTTWNLIHTFSDVIEQFYIHKTQTNIIYAAARDGVYKSTDSAATWAAIYSGRTYDIEAKPGMDSVLYIAVENSTLIRPEIKKSTDSGVTWTLMDNGFYTPSVPSEATIYGCKIGVTPADPNRLYAGIIANGKAGDNGWIGIYYSLDEGATWQDDSGFDGGPYVSGNDASTNWYVAGYSSGYHQGFYNFDLDVSHNDADRLWLGTIWFCESGNKGGNIEYIRGTRDLNMHADVQDIDVHGNDIWIASDGGINFSDDECATVSTRMKGINASDYWGFGQGWNEDTWVGGRYHNGNAVAHENYGEGNTIFLGGAEDPTGYVNQMNNKNSYYSDVGGKRAPETYTQDAAGITNLGLMPTQAYFHFSYSEVEWDPNYGNRVFVGRDNALFHSQNAGISFDTLYTFPVKNIGGTDYTPAIRRFEVSRANSDYIYAIIYYSYWNWSVHKSIDGGQSFTEIPQPNLTGGSWRELSLTLNPFDKDEIWLASRSSSDGNKVFSSLDAGDTWTSRYTAMISGEGVKDMIYQANDVSDKVYIMTNDNYFYYDKGSSTWTEWNTGLPAAHKGFMTLPFYRDNKIRMASAKGIWEAEMLDQSKVQANPMAELDTVFCPRDTISLESYSIVEQTGTTWLWTINPAPSYIDNANTRNPKIVLGATGSYDVTLTVTDSNGSSDSRTVASMIFVEDNCTPGTSAGNSLQTFANGDFAVVDEANLTNITHFTVTGWWKPNGVQQAYSALFSSGDWCAHCETTEGLIFDYYGSKLWYKWPGEGNPWANNSGIDIPLDEWSYVALVIEPTGATMYLNDQKYVHSRVLTAGEISNLHLGYGHYSKSFKGEIDEVTMWNRALTEDEVYRMRHITKEEEIANDPSLIAYYQFNTIQAGGFISDNARTMHAALKSAATITESSVPVGKGVAQLIDLSDTQYSYQFTDNETEIRLADCDVPQGKMVITRIENAPDTLPAGTNHPGDYWVINHYGAGVPQIDSLSLTPSSIDFQNAVINPTQVALYTRTENAEGYSWDSRSKARAYNGNAIEFDRYVNVNDRVQIGLSELNESIQETDPGIPCEADTIPGQLLTLAGNSGDYLTIPAMNLNSNTITMSAWVKSDGLQNSWAGLIFSRSGGTVAGLSAANGDNELRYHWNGGEWSWGSGAYLPETGWHHVALVITPSTATIYLDGIAYSRNVTHNPEEFDGVTRIGNDANSGARTFRGEMDEVCIWNRALSQDEIRGLRHLTKEEEVETDPDLVVYLQFNEDVGKAYDKSGNRLHATFSGSTGRADSPAPVGGGTSEKIVITSDGTYSSASTGIDITFGAGGTNPDGEIVVSRINLQPNVYPGVHPISRSYWVINNYGNNQTFTGLTNFDVTDIGNTTPITTAVDLGLYNRRENETGAWSNIATGTTYEAVEGSVGFATTAVTRFGQFTIENPTGKGWIGVQDEMWNNPANWGDNMVPAITEHVIIPADVPFQPMVDLNGGIKSINLMPGARLYVPLGVLFDID